MHWRGLQFRETETAYPRAVRVRARVSRGGQCIAGAGERCALELLPSERTDFNTGGALSASGRANDNDSINCIPLSAQHVLDRALALALHRDVQLRQHARRPGPVPSSIKITRRCARAPSSHRRRACATSLRAHGQHVANVFPCPTNTISQTISAGREPREHPTPSGSYPTFPSCMG